MQPKPPADDRSIQVPSRQDNSVRVDDRDAAAAYMRQQIDRIYEIESQEVPERSDEDKSIARPVSDIDPYHRSHSEATAHNQAASDSAAQWKHYHSAWQSYYQQYYERYYLQQLHARRQKMQGQSSTQSAAPAMVTAGVPETEPLSRDQAVSELRNQLIDRVNGQSQKLRKSRHFMPIVSALVVVLVIGILQYNRLIVAQVKAYVSPGSIEAQNIIIDPNGSTKVGPEPKLVIPKINVEAPVVYDVPSLQESIIQSKLEDGVVHYPIPGASSVPGQNGNTVILGHSSNDVFDNGDYKFVFVQLDQLGKGDTFYLHYEGTRYTYRVTGKEIINPDQVGKLVLPGDKPVATLVTCTPPGTALKRLVVYADQISPDPNKASSIDQTKQANPDEVSLPGNSPSLLERLFSGS